MWQGVFHAVSAFCNAGFSLQPDSLVRWRADLLVNAVVTGLILVGGLGFLVNMELRGQVEAILRPDHHRGGGAAGGVHRAPLPGV